MNLDSLRRVEKFENETDSIILIAKPRKIIVKTPIIVEDTLSFKEDIKIGVSSKNVQANNKGRANVEIVCKNESNSTYKNVLIVLECVGAKREWTGDLNAKSEMKLSFNVPAKFSAKEIKRKITVITNYKQETVTNELSVNIKRYMPVRSR